MRFLKLQGTLPAQTAVILKSAVAQTFVLPFGDQHLAAGEVTGNELLGTTSLLPISQISADAEHCYYVLSKQRDGLGFYRVNADIPAGKAYLKVPITAQPVSAFRFSEGMITRIGALPVAATQQVSYDLGGKQQTHPISGQLYIVDGQKRWAK